MDLGDRQLKQIVHFKLFVAVEGLSQTIEKGIQPGFSFSPFSKETQSLRVKDTQGRSDRLFEISRTVCGPAHPGCHLLGIVLPIPRCRNRRRVIG